MADKKENSDEQERKIPVFTVLKKGKIFKNIFLLDAPSPISEKESLGFEENIKTSSNQKDEEEEKEEILLVGRHPDCNIMLEHPSISRFHLRIHSKPSLQKLSVIDLSSAHGTWVSDRKIEPEVRVEMRDGDTLRLGASTRVYRLHWFPLDRAFDVDYSLLSPIAEHPLASEEKETFQNENVIPSAPPMPENMNSPFTEEEEAMWPAPMLKEKENHSPLRVLEQNGLLSMWSESVNSSSFPAEKIFCEASNNEFYKENQENLKMVFAENVLVDIENQESPLKRLEEKSDTPSIWSRRGKSASLIRIETGRSRKKDVDASRGVGVEVENQNENKDGLVSKVLFSASDGEEEMFTPDKENCTPKTVLRSKSSRKGRIEEIKSGKSSRSLSRKLLNEMNRVQGEGDEQVTKVLFYDLDSEEEIFTPDKENLTPNSAKRGRIEEIKHRKSSGSMSRKIMNCMNRVQDGGDELVSKALFSDVDEEEEIFTPNKENLTPYSVKKGRVKEVKHRMAFGSLSPKATSNTNGDQNKGMMALSEEEEIFTPNKENFTPYSVKKGRVEEVKHRVAFGSSSPKATSDANGDQNKGMMTLSEKENLTPVVLRDSRSKIPTSVNRLRQENQMIMNKRTEGRVPFQTLVVNSTSKSKSEIQAPNVTTAKSSNSVNCGQSSANSPATRRWYMVVDTSCLTNRESRRSLQLLQGLKGTQLIIPRMVIRELDCLKRRSNLFRRETEASSAFQWIEECMVQTSWWIHVQNSMEEGMPVAPTPPASPRVSEGGASSRGLTSLMPFSTCGSLVEIVSPTAQDHILECALLFKRIKNDGHVALLTNDVALKINAMAEGLLCETAEDFRESLVNPWSERFLWVESSPRGPTWSCLEAAELLRENHHHFPVKKAVKIAEGAKGLKLILLHNSHYGQMHTFT